MPAKQGRCTLSEDGRTQTWHTPTGAKHRDRDRPAVVRTDETGRIVLREWWNFGVRHRGGDEPAVIDETDGVMREWWAHGTLHRANDMPAIVKVDGADDTSGFCEWWVEGRRHLS